MVGRLCRGAILALVKLDALTRCFRILTDKAVELGEFARRGHEGKAEPVDGGVERPDRLQGRPGDRVGHFLGFGHGRRLIGTATTRAMASTRSSTSSGVRMR